jgi:Flp pilus assembly protein TadB
MKDFIALFGMLSVFGLLTALFALYLRQRHRERMGRLGTQVHNERVAQLETARADLESRVRTLEDLVMSGDRDLQEQSRRQSATAWEKGEHPMLSGTK